MWDMVWMLCIHPCPTSIFYLCYNSARRPRMVLLIVLLALAGAIIPTIFYINLIWWLDRYEREPLWLLAAAFLWGAIPAVIGGGILEVIFDAIVYGALGHNALTDALSFGASPPLFEESAKGIFLVGL